MKSIGSTLLLCCFIVVGLRGQLTMGIKAGISANNLKAAHFDDSFYDTYPTIVGGLAAEWKLSEKFSIQSEILYSRQGAEIEGEEILLRLNYLNVPMLAKYFASNRLYLATGIQTGYLLEMKRPIPGPAPEVLSLIAQKNKMRSFDYSLPIGIGYTTELGIQVDLRYYLGLSNVFEDAMLDSRNRIVQITMIYLLPRKKKANPRQQRDLPLPLCF